MCPTKSKLNKIYRVPPPQGGICERASVSSVPEENKAGEENKLMKQQSIALVTIPVFVKRQSGSEVSKTFAPKETPVRYEKNLRSCSVPIFNRSNPGWRRTTFLRSWSSSGHLRCLFVGARRSSCARVRALRVVVQADQQVGQSFSRPRHSIRYLHVRQAVRSNHHFVGRSNSPSVSPRR